MLVITKDLAGQRLDALLAVLCPGLGLRGRRRLIAQGRVLVNGCVGEARVRVREGDQIVLTEYAPTPDLAVHIVREDDDCLFLEKPRFLHTSSIAGSAAPSLEAALCAHRPGVILLQRLDFATSGLVCAAKNAAFAASVRTAEQAGLLRKKYCALLEGRVREALVIRARLCTDSCARTRVRPEPGDPLRRTVLEPLVVFDKGEPLPPWLTTSLGRVAPCVLTLAGCTIYKGARHQIRAHCAFQGFPLVGDTLYGARLRIPKEPDGAFYLHTAGLYLPDRSCVLLPPWFGLDVENPLTHWLASP